MKSDRANADIMSHCLHVSSTGMYLALDFKLQSLLVSVDACRNQKIVWERSGLSAGIVKRSERIPPSLPIPFRTPPQGRGKVIKWLTSAIEPPSSNSVFRFSLAYRMHQDIVGLHHQIQDMCILFQ